MKLISVEGIPYKDDVHLAAGVYDGLKREAFMEGAQAQLDSCEKQLKEKMDNLTVLSGCKREAILNAEYYNRINPGENVVEEFLEAQLDDVKRRLKL